MQDFKTPQSKFLANCRRKNLSGYTLRAYKQDLNDYATWAERSASYVLVSKESIQDWMADMSDRGLAPTTIKRRLACMKVFCRWMEEEGELDFNPFIHFRTTVKIPTRLPRNLTNQELRALIGKRTQAQWKYLGHKHKTLLLALEILYATGIRVGELCSIDLKHIDLETGAITINGKGKRERKVYVADAELKQIIKNYITERHTTSPLTDHLLTTKRGASLSPDQLRKSLHKHVEDLGLKRRVTPHMFRHTTATQLLESGVDIRFVQKLLGHASISTTEIYTHVSDAKLQQVISSANLRSALK